MNERERPQLMLMPLWLMTSRKGRVPDERLIYHAVESQHWSRDFPFRAPGIYYQAFCGVKGLWWQETKNLSDIEEARICKRCLRYVVKTKEKDAKLGLRRKTVFA